MRATSISTSVELGLRFIGIWPDLPYGTFTWFTYMTSVVIMLYFEYMYIFDHFDIYNVSNLIDAFSIALVSSLSFLKLISLWSHRRVFYNILLTINEDWNDILGRDQLILRTMSSNASLSRRCSNTLISINAIAAICYTVTNFTQYSADLKTNLSLRELPLKMQFPFDINASPLFEFLAVAQFLHAVSIASLAAMINCLIITLVLHISGQIDILRQELSTMCYKNSIIANIKLLIIRHQRIIMFSDNIEELYSEIALMQFLSNTIVICCIGFTFISSLTKDGTIMVLLKCVSFYIATTLEAFIFCFVGEYLTAKSISIGDAAYESLWYNMTPTECRILLFVILRSQKRLTISAGNIIDLSLEGFTSVMKASASYMSVLHAMY